MRMADLSKGSYFELSMEYSNGLKKDTVLKIINHLWNINVLKGPWKSNENFSLPFDTVTLDDINYDLSGNYLYGVINIEHTELGCISMFIIEQDGSDWIDLCIPTAMIEFNYDIEYPLYLKRNKIIQTIEYALLDIATEIYNVVPFDLALIGEEISGYFHADTLQYDEIDTGGVVLPKKLLNKINTNNKNDIQMNNGSLVYFPIKYFDE